MLPASCPVGEIVVQTCVQCGTTSQFLTWDTLSFCHHCAPDHSAKVVSAIDGIASEADVRPSMRDAKRQLASIERSVEHCRSLLEYPRLRIDGLDPQKLLGELEQIRTDVVEQAIRDHWFRARER